MVKFIVYCATHLKKLPPNEAATATEPATDPAAVAIAAKPPAPTIGTRVPNVGAKAPKPAAIAGAARPIKKSWKTLVSDRLSFYKKKTGNNSHYFSIFMFHLQ